MIHQPNLKKKLKNNYFSKLTMVKLSNFNKFSNRIELIRFCHGEPYPNFYEFFYYFCVFLYKVRFGSIEPNRSIQHTSQNKPRQNIDGTWMEQVQSKCFSIVLIHFIWWDFIMLHFWRIFLCVPFLFCAVSNYVPSLFCLG